MRLALRSLRLELQMASVDICPSVIKIGASRLCWMMTEVGKNLNSQNSARISNIEVIAIQKTQAFRRYLYVFEMPLVQEALARSSPLHPSLRHGGSEHSTIR